MEPKTIFHQIYISNWDSQLATEFINVPNENAIITVSIDPPKHFTIKVYEKSNLIDSFISQPIKIKNDGAILIIIIWDGNHIVGLMLGKNKIDNYKNKNIIEIEAVRNKIIKSNIYDEPNILEKCSEWMAWRKKYYSRPKPLSKKNTILKSESEQKRELEESIMSLVDLHNDVFIANKRYKLADIYSLLRRLLFWPDETDKNKIYSPLLIRVAGYENLPLPVYATPSKNSVKDLAKIQIVIQIQIDNQMASTNQKDERMIIMDLQEWLSQPIITTKNKIYRVKDLLFDSANSWGAHNDQSIPFFLDKTRNINILSDNFLFILIKNISEVTIDLGKYITNKME
jgi:hypothetical protein